MALQFIVGGSGSGKTQWVYRQILEQAEINKQKNFYMIVPEQFTMQAQKALVALQKNHAIMNIDVVSFERLAYRIFDELGLSDLAVLEDTGKNLMIRKLAGDCREQLVTLKNQVHKISYVDQIKSLISEFMQYGIEPETLEQYLETMGGNSALYYKLQDIHRIYHAFDEYLREGYVTSERILDVLAARVKDSRLLADAVLVFDGFTGFTPVQMHLMRELLRVAAQSTVTVTMDPDAELYADKGIQDLFYMSRKMMRGLSKLAEEVGCEIVEPVLLDITKSGCVGMVKPGLHRKNCRYYDNPLLQHLEQQLFRPGAVAYTGDMECVGQTVIGTMCSIKPLQIYSLSTPKEELIFAAIRIRQMIREQGLRYQDFAIVSGNVAGYEKYAKEVFEMYDIPYFSDVKETIYYHPFTEWVRALLDIFETGFSYDSVMRYLRCGLSGFATEELDILDNYLLERGIHSYKKWNTKWVHPTKYVKNNKSLTDAERTASLDVLNQMRKRFLGQIEPIHALIQNGQVQVEAVTRALYEIMADLEIQQQLKDKQELHEAAGNEYLAATYGQIYKIVIDLLDKMVDLLGSDILPIREYGQILDAGFLAAKVGTIPPGADCVLLGDIERTRLGQIKVLFFLGVNEGIVPKTADRKNLLSQYDRERMAREHMELAPTAKEQVFLQKFYLYLNMTKPEQALILTYARMDSKGSGIKPSYLVETMCRMFPALKTEYVEGDFAQEMMTPKSSTQQYVKGLQQAREGQVSPEWTALHQWRMAQPAFVSQTERLVDAAFAVFEGESLKPDLAKKLYGQVLYHSVTRLETFFQCACQHFFRYGLKLEERQEYGFETRDMGTLFHDALERYCGKMQEEHLDWFTITEVQQKQLLKQALSDTLLGMDTDVLSDSARNQYMVNRIERILHRSVWALTRQLRKGSFVPEAYEMGFSQEVPLADAGATMMIRGKIDRLDLCWEADNCYVKVMDYKSGRKKFELGHIYQGLDMQLPLYLHSARVRLEAELAAKGVLNPVQKVIPAAMLYYQMEEPTLDLEDAESVTEQEMEQQIFRKLRPTGLVNNNNEVIKRLDCDMDAEAQNTGASDVIPVKRNKNGDFSKRDSKIATTEQFDLLDRFVMHKIQEAGHRMMEGEIAAQPLDMADADGCMYCEYQDICGFDPRIPGYEKYQPKMPGNEEDIWLQMSRDLSEDL